MANFYASYPFEAGSGTTGTVTSVGLADLTGLFNITGSPVTTSGTLTLASFNNNVITNSTLAKMPPNTIKGNNSGSTANASDLTISQVNTMLGDILADGSVPMTANFDFGSFNGINLLDPTTSQMAATKNYVDSVVNGTFYKAAANYASVAALPSNTYNNGASGVGATLTATANGALSVDGVAVVANNRLLIKNEVTQSHNGIYMVTATGSAGTPYVLTRSSDFNSSSNIATGDALFVTAGNTLSSTSWALNTSGTITVGTTALTFVQISGIGTITAGTGISITGTTISLVTPVAIVNGGTGQVTANAAFNALSPMNTLGDIIYEDATPTAVSLSGNTTSTKKFLTQTGTGSISAAPAWNTISSGDLPAGTGTVTSVSVVSANGLAGTVATATTTPAITLSTTITGILQGNGTAISAATTGNLTDAGTDGIVVTGGTGAVLGSGTSLAQHVADTTHNGYLSSTDWNTFNGKQSSGNYITALTGDVTATGPGSVAATLATVNSNVGSFGSSTAIPSFTVNGKGLLTAASTNVVIAPAGTLTGTTLASNVVSSSLTSVGTITSGTWNGTTIAIANGGTNNTSAYTSGSIIFSNGTSLTQDNAAFYWDDTNKALGLGIQPATNTTIDSINSSGSSKAIQQTSYGTGSSSVYRGRFARGTSGSPAAAQNGDLLAVISGRGYGTSQFATASTGAINIIAGETFTNTSNATYLNFSVTPTASVTVAEAMRLNSTGNLLIGTTTDSGTQKLQVNGNSNVGTVTAGTWTGTTIAIANGGTGQTTKAAAFDALQPMTTGGDVIYGGASGTGTRLANGTSGQVLTSAGGTSAPTWGSAVGLVQLGTTTANGSVASVTFSSISGSYTNLLLRMQTRSASSSGNNDTLFLRFNSDTASNYDWVGFYGGNASTSGTLGANGATSIEVGFIDNANATANYANATTIEIPNYSGSTFYKGLNSRSENKAGTTNSVFTISFSGYWKNTAAVTSVTLFTSSGSNFVSGSMFVLYGLL